MYKLVFSCFPKSGFSRLMGFLASSQPPGWLLRLIIRLYVAVFRINMAECAMALREFTSFNQFFTRPLKPGARPLDAGPRVVVSPVDGHVSQSGPITAGQLIQAKGIRYPVEALLGGDESFSRYEGGHFVTIYLSPRDYHRIHTPLDCAVTRFSYVPGALWTVSPAGVKGVAGLFAKNERTISFLETSFGEMALVKVGATVVGKIKVVYHGVESNLKGAAPLAGRLEKPYPLAKGQELGRFELGSTVILLFPPGAVALDPLPPETPLRMGAAIGRLL